jgi:hypothetical protein
MRRARSSCPRPDFAKCSHGRELLLQRRVPEIGREPDTVMVRGAVFDPQVDFAVPPLARW